MILKLHHKKINNLIMNKIILMLLFCSVSFYSNADTTLVYSSPEQKTTPLNRLLIKDGKVQSWQNSNQYTLFDSKTSRVFLVNTQNKSYTELKPQSFNKLKLAPDVQEKIKKSMKDVKKMLKNMPKEQRQKVEAKFKEKLAEQGIDFPSDKYPDLESSLDRVLEGAFSESVKIPKVTHVKTKQTKKINGYQCNVKDAFINNKKMFSSCVTPIEKIGLSKKDSKTYLNFTKKMQKIGGVKSPKILPELPISTTSYQNNKQARQQLNKVVFDDLKVDFFKIPKDYKQTETYQAK